jgi:hypothetical protein
MKPARPSDKMAANARKNKGKTPWRTQPHVSSPANKARHEGWQQK